MRYEKPSRRICAALLCVTLIALPACVNEPRDEAPKAAEVLDADTCSFEQSLEDRRRRDDCRAHCTDPDRSCQAITGAPLNVAGCEAVSVLDYACTLDSYNNDDFGNAFCPTDTIDPKMDANDRKTSCESYRELKDCLETETLCAANEKLETIYFPGLHVLCTEGDGSISTLPYGKVECVPLVPSPVPSVPPADPNPTVTPAASPSPTPNASVSPSPTPNASLPPTPTPSPSPTPTPT